MWGENDYDSYRLPIEFLFDESYPEKYKLIYIDEQRKKKKELEKKCKEELDKNKQNIEAYDLKEYKRLKLKYEDNIV